MALYIVTYVAFLVLGGVVFATLEEENQLMLKARAADLKRAFLDRNPDVDEADLEALLNDAQSYNDIGISVLEKDRFKRIWNFGESIMFTVTVVTTIGKFNPFLATLR